MIREDQYDEIHTQGLNLSGLLRDLLDDYLSEHKITLNVSEKTHQLYSQIVSNTGTTDAEIEPYFKSSLEKLLTKKIKQMQDLHKKEFT